MDDLSLLIVRQLEAQLNDDKETEQAIMRAALLESKEYAAISPNDRITIPAPPINMI